MPQSARSRLTELGRLLTECGRDAASRKLACLRELERARLGSAGQVLRLHEALCILRAYPDDVKVLVQVKRMLEGFELRADLRRFRHDLTDSGIAGTDVYFPFFQLQARELARRYGNALTIDWASFKARERLRPWLEALMLESEAPALDEVKLSVRKWVERLKRTDESDATFILRSVDAFEAPAAVRRCVVDGLDIPFRLSMREGGPSRTRTLYERAPVHFHRTPLNRGRPDLTTAARRKPRSVRSVSTAEGRTLIELACDAMASRRRDLDSFSSGNPEDVRVIDLGEGLVLACIGLLPEERLVLEALYGFLILKNGVPIGYALAGALFRSSDVAYNIFETFRGAEAARIYGRILGAVHALLGSDCFCVVPYQLGHRNEEGLASGAWWFYQKLGFRPRDPAVLRSMRDELAAMRRDPRHRSNRATLRRLSSKPVFWSLGKPREDVIGRIPMERICLAVTDSVAKRFGSARLRGRRLMSAEAARRLQVRGRQTWSRRERLAWERWSPILLLLPGVERWRLADKRALVRVVRAKAGRRETDYLALFERHGALKRALLQLARSGI